MNKEHFNRLVSDYSNLDGKFYDLENLAHKFPYSQPIRMLNAKSSSSLTKAEFQQRITLAAFYATDRTVLRSFIEQGKVPSDLGLSTPTATPAPTQKSKNAPPKPAVAKQKPAPKKQQSMVSGKIDAAKLREEVMYNLEELMKSKAHFLELDALDEKQKLSRKATEVQKASTTLVQERRKPAASPKPVESSKEETAKPSKRRSKKDELIEKFIATEPRITPNKAPTENQSDLSRASSELKEDLVSENLAIIFAGQGKTAKAIEIYKKLIWKFPQKKASFAARIEELKKK